MPAAYQPDATGLLLQPRWCTACGRRVIHSEFACCDRKEPEGVEMQFEFWYWRYNGPGWANSQEWGMHGVAWPVGGKQ